MPDLRITILGAGNVGGILGRKWIDAGHTVAFGVKDPASARAQSLREEAGAQLTIGTPAQVLVNCDLVLLAVPGNVVQDVIADHAQLLDHKIVIDATNQIFKGRSEASGQWQRHEILNSLGSLQSYTPHAQVYRAFNSYSWEIFAQPDFHGVQADLFYCGPDGASQAIVEQLIAEVGVNPVYLGGLDQIGQVDEVLHLWASLALFRGLGRDRVAFKVLTR